MTVTRATKICFALGLLLAGLAVAGTGHGSTSEIWIEEGDLLDVGIMVFDPGSEKKSYLLTGYEYINPRLRDSEAAFMAVHMMKTLQETRKFGLVRMMPRNSVSADLFVEGRIRKSSGRRLVLEVRVIDATGRRWFKRSYKQKASPVSYAYSYHGKLEPFQEVYDQFAEDLIDAQSRMRSESLETTRRVAELRFAAQLAPGVFGDYLKTRPDGRVGVQRLPAREDPMLRRVRHIRTRDEFFLDLLAERYNDFYASMDKAYDEYRATSYDVELALSDARALATLANASVLFDRPNETYHERQRSLREIEFYRRQVAAQYEYLEEIAESFTAEVEPLKLELDGEVIRFQGTIEEQYSQWQELLETIFETETGMSARDRVFVGEVGRQR